MEKWERTPKQHHSMMTNTKTKMLLAQFVISKVQEAEIKDKITPTKSLEDILIEELNKKPVVPGEHYPDNYTTRSIDVIMYCLDHLKEFFRYKMFNSLDNKDIRSAANYFKHAHYAKGDYIFRFQEGSNRFFGIIKGKVGIRGIKYSTNTDFITYYKRSDPELEEIVYREGIAKDERLQLLLEKDDSFSEVFFNEGQLGNRLSENELRFELEFEKITFSAGMCLGEWGIIDNVPRTASVLCKEETDAFYCEKEPFMKYLSMSFIRSTSSKRLFLNQMLPGLAKSFVNVVPLFFHKNNIIYTRFDYADFIYVVYQGECSYVHVDHPLSTDNIQIRRNEWKVLYIVEKGSIMGLESLQYDTPSKKHTASSFQPVTTNPPPRKCYDYNLIASKDFTAVYRIHINLLSELGYDSKEYLRNIYQLHEKRLKGSEEKVNHFRMKVKTQRHQKVMSNEDVFQCANVALDTINMQAKKKNETRNWKRLKAFMVFPSNSRVSNETSRAISNKKSIRPQTATHQGQGLKTFRITTQTPGIKGDNYAESNLLLTQASAVDQPKRNRNSQHKKKKSNSPADTYYQSEFFILQNQTSITQPQYKVKAIRNFPVSNSRKPKCLNIRHQLILNERNSLDSVHQNSRSLPRKSPEYTYYNSGFFEMPLITDILNKSNKLM